MASPPPVAPIIAQLERVNGEPKGGQDAFDYACSKARAEAIDALLLAVLEERGWSLFDDAVLDRVTVDHDGDTRARILIDGQPVTPWWADRVVTTERDVTWCFEREE